MISLIEESVIQAAELFSNYVEYFPIGDCTAGIVFLDTVHHCTDSEAVLTAVKTTVAANLQNNSPKPSPEDTRQFAEAVREINKAFGEKVPPSMEILNVVAMRRIEIMSDDASSYKTLVSPFVIVLSDINCMAHTKSRLSRNNVAR